MAMRTLLLLLASGLGAFSALSTDSIIETRADGMWLVFSNTPASWQLERTEDLFLWHPVLRGWTTNTVVECRIQSGLEAVFYRVVAMTDP
jgi:hypothetical protein